MPSLWHKSCPRYRKFNSKTITFSSQKLSFNLLEWNTNNQNQFQAIEKIFIQKFQKICYIKLHHILVSEPIVALVGIVSAALLFSFSSKLLIGSTCNILLFYILIDWSILLRRRTYFIPYIIIVQPNIYSGEL